MKRSSERQITKNDDHEGSDEEGGSDNANAQPGEFKRASAEILATRKFVKVKRRPTPPASSPLAGISFSAAPADDPAGETAAAAVAATSKDKGEPEKTPPVSLGGAVEDKDPATQQGNSTAAAVTSENGGDAVATQSGDPKPLGVGDVGGTRTEAKENTAGPVAKPANAIETPVGATEEHVGKTAGAADGPVNTPVESTGTTDKIVEAVESPANAADKPADVINKPADTVEKLDNAADKPAESSASASAPTFPAFNFGASSASTDGKPSFNFSGLAAAPATSFAFRPPTLVGKAAVPGTGDQPEEFNGGEDGPSLPASGIQKAAEPILPEKDVVTGEEGEKEIFRAKSKVYRLEEDSWKERGTGALKVNTSQDGGAARVLMRAEGAQRVVLNFALWKTFKGEKASDKSARFTVADDEGKPASFLARFSTQDELKNFLAAVQTTVKALAEKQ